jgi:hypothetical protein
MEILQPSYAPPKSAYGQNGHQVKGNHDGSRIRKNLSKL